VEGQTWAYLVPGTVKNLADIEKLIQCESQGVNVSRPDSDGIISDGILQFHRGGTWQEMSRLSGIKGSPINPPDAIRMADFMISHGFLGRWTCAHILGLVPVDK
jgi:hypothetical protein